jgi:lambda family phage portal protein
VKKASLNLIDKAVAFLNPQGAVDRLVARQKLVNFSYDAVKYSRERKGPSSLSGAEDYRSNYDRVELMKRARDLAENVGLVRSILMKFASHTAANISYQARTENPEVNTDVEAYWAEWWDRCDLTTRHTGSTLMQVAMMSMLRDGDFLIVLVRDKDGNLKIQGIEADRLGDPFRTYTSLDLIGGIHIDRNTGAPTAYDIFNRSIGDFYTYQATIPSSQAFHLFDPLRIDQYRGVSAFHTAINDCTDIYDIINFEKMASKNASSQAGIVKRNNNNASDLSSLTNDEDVNGNTIKLEAIQSGKISYLEPGEDIVFPDGPSRPSGAFAEFHKILLRNICLGLGIPYSFAVDPSAMSGPTARLEMQQAGRTFRRYQKLLDDKVLRPIKNIVIADAVSRGLIENNVGTRTTKGIFNFGANVSIDLGRESASAISEFKTGLRTAADIYAERGQDFESAMRQRAIEAKLIKDLAEKYGVAPETISDIVTPTPPQPQQPTAPAPKPVAPAKDEPEEGEDEGGDQKPIPEDPIDPSSEELEVKKKETDLEGNCGTGAGGFQPGNECSKGGGDGGKVIAYHGTSKEAAEKIEKYGYDMEKSTDGGMWLTPNKSKIEGKETGAGQHGGVVERVIDESKLKLGGWKEYDKYGTDELVSQGYDGLKLVDGEDIAYKIFNPQKLTKVINKSKKLEALDCGTGSGGFKEGNTCAGGGDGSDKEEDDYKGIHRPPSKKGGAPLNDLTGAGEVYPDDIYGPKAAQYYGTGMPSMDRKTVGIIQSLRGKPDAEVTIYRAVPNNVKDEIKSGDWITINRDYAIQHGESTLRGNYKIASLKAKASDIFGNGDSIHEYGYDPQPQKKKSLESVEVLSSLTTQDLKMLIAGMMGGIELAKYDGIDFTPPEGAREAAKRALDVREGKPASQRGMTPVGIARARDLQNGVKMSPDTVRRMKAFFDRHEVDKNGSTWDEQGKGWQAWNGWGGDAGYSWAKKIVGQMDARDNKELARPVSQTPAPPKERIKGSKENPKGTASTRSKAGDIEISAENEEALKNKIAEFKDKHPTRKAPTLGALKKVFRRGAGAFSTSFRPTITGGKPNSRNAWAMARVNKFLKMAGGGEVKESYRKADGDLL